MAFVESFIPSWTIWFICSFAIATETLPLSSPSDHNKSSCLPGKNPRYENFETDLVLLDWHSPGWRRIIDTITKFEKRNSKKFCISRFGYFDAICWSKKKPNLSIIGEWTKFKNAHLNKKLRFLVVSQKHGMQSGHHAIIFCLILQERWMISIYLVKSQSHLLKKKTDKLNQPIRLQNHLIRKSTTQPSLLRQVRGKNMCLAGWVM